MPTGTSWAGPIGDPVEAAIPFDETRSREPRGSPPEVAEQPALFAHLQTSSPPWANPGRSAPSGT